MSRVTDHSLEPITYIVLRRIIEPLSYESRENLSIVYQVQLTANI